MDEIKTECSDCKYGCSLNCDDQKETWCSNDVFEIRQGYKNFPVINDCELYEPKIKRRIISYGNLGPTGHGDDICFSDADSGL